MGEGCGCNNLAGINDNGFCSNRFLFFILIFLIIFRD